MTKKKTIFLIYLFFVIVLVIVGSMILINSSKVSKIANLKDHINPATPIPSMTAQPTPTRIPYTISLTAVPEELQEGETATFIWNVNGPPQISKKSTIYYGQASDTQIFDNTLSPENSRYTESLKDFIQGNFTIPLQFTESTSGLKPGTYFFRGYILIEGKHYWTEERSFIVKESPLNEIKIIDPPAKIHKGENITFTWDIKGPGGTTESTGIVAGKESKPGSLDKSVSITMTPYQLITKDYANGTYTIPLRFIANTSFPESGVYYIRAIAFINEKNIWSDEYTLTAE